MTHAERRIIVTENNPYHYITILIASIIYAAAGLITGGTTNSVIARQLGPAFQYVWFAFLFVGATIALGAVYFRKTIKGLLIERIGLTVMTGILFTYACASIAVNGLRSIHWAVIAIGIVIIVTLVFYGKIVMVILVGVAVLIVSGSQGTIIFFGIAVANLYRIVSLNNVIKDIQQSKALASANATQSPIEGE